MSLKSCLKKYNITGTQAKEIVALSKKYEETNRGKHKPTELKRVSAFNAVEEYISNLNDKLEEYGEPRVDYKVPEKPVVEEAKTKQEPQVDNSKHNNKVFNTKEEANAYLKDNNLEDTFRTIEVGGKHVIHEVTKGKPTGVEPTKVPTLSKVKTVKDGLAWYEAQKNKDKAKDQLIKAIGYTDDPKRVTLLMDVESAINNKGIGETQSEPKVVRRKAKKSETVKPSNTRLDRTQLEQVDNKKLSAVATELETMFAQSNKKFFSKIAQHLAKVFKRMELKGFNGTLSVVNDLSDDIHEVFLKRKGVEGLALDNGDIQIHVDKANKYTVMHELVHQATMYALKNNKIAQVELGKLLETVKSHLKNKQKLNMFEQAVLDGKINALDSIDELIASSFTNSAFQQVLRTINIRENSKGIVQTALDKFVNIIKKLLNIPTEYSNTLTDVITQGLELMDEQTESDTTSTKVTPKSLFIDRGNNEMLSGSVGGNNATYEMVDIDSVFNSPSENTKETTVGKLLDHKLLYKYYPELKNMKVHIVDDSSGNVIGGWYSSKDRDITLGKSVVNKENLLHEVQHAVQHLDGRLSSYSLNLDEVRSWDSIAHDIKTISKQKENLKDTLTKTIQNLLNRRDSYKTERTAYLAYRRAIQQIITKQLNIDVNMIPIGATNFVSDEQFTNITTDKPKPINNFNIDDVVNTIMDSIDYQIRQDTLSHLALHTMPRENEAYTTSRRIYKTREERSKDNSNYFDNVLSAQKDLLNKINITKQDINEFNKSIRKVTLSLKGQDVSPSIKDTVIDYLDNKKDLIDDPNTVAGFVKEKFHKIFYPYGLSASDLSDKGRAVIREQFGKSNTVLNRLSNNIRGYRKAFSKLSTSLQKEISDAWESTDTDAEFRKRIEALGMSDANVEITDNYFVNIHKPFMDDALKTLQEMGHDYSRISHYIQHLYTSENKAQKLLIKYFTQKKPLSGNKKFTKQRLYETMKEVEALAKEDGTKLERSFPNPADSTFAYATQFLKYKAARGIFDELKQSNLLAFARKEENVPEGWSSIDDAIFKVMRPIFYTSKKTGETKMSGLLESGKYYAPDSIAQMLNNYLSPGLDNPIANTLRDYNNRLNMIQLGFSVFHGAFEVILNGVNNLTLALTYINAGDLQQAKKYLMKTAMFPVSWIGDLRKSTQYKDYILHPEKYKNNEEARTIVEAFTRANGVLGLEKHYRGFQTKQLDALRTAMADNDVFKALPAAIGSVVELASKPIMEHMVPALKLNAFVQLYRAEVAKLEKLGSKQESGKPIDYHKIAMNMWDRVDDRFGQMTYDNLFWNKTAKDILHLTTRSVGWNYGDLRELGLSIPDTIRLLTKTYKADSGDRIATLRRNLTQRILFAGSLFAVTMYAGAIVTYLATGKPPDDFDDLLNPQTNVKGEDGKNIRLGLPSYTRDVQAVVNAIMSDHTINGLTEIIKHKRSPLVGLISEYAQNRDYFGNEIVTTTGTMKERAVDRGLFLMRHLTPFSWTTTARLVKKTGNVPMSSLYSLLGLTPAPKYITQTKLENDIDHFVNLTYGGVRTKEQQEKIKMLSKISADYTRTGRWNNEKIREAVKKGYIKNITRFKMSRMKYSASVRKFGMLAEDIQVYLYERMSATDRKKYAPKLKKKSKKMLLRKGIH